MQFSRKPFRPSAAPSRGRESGEGHGEAGCGLAQSGGRGDDLCGTCQVILPAIKQLAAGSMERLQKIADAVDALISPYPLRREFFAV